MPVPAGTISPKHSESISIFIYPCQFQQELFLETTLWKHFYLYLPMPVAAGAISRDNTLRAFLSLPTHASCSRSYFPRQHWKHFYLYLPMPVPAGTISQDNTLRAFLSLPTLPVAAGAISRDNTESISIFTYPCQFQQELFPETTLRAFLSLPTHASSSRSIFPRQHWEHFYLYLPMPILAGDIFRDNTESISIFTYPCQFQQELFPKTSLREYFYLYLPVPVPAGAISWDNTLRAFLSLPTHASSSKNYFPRQHLGVFLS